MAPGNIYLLTFALVAIPLLPFSRMALVVTLAWLPGQFAYVAGIDPTAIDMCVAVMAFGAGMGLARCWQERVIASLFLSGFLVLLLVGTGRITAHDGWWLDWSLSMLRVLLLPTTLNWQAIRDVMAAFNERREIDRNVWQRVLCWQSI